MKNKKIINLDIQTIYFPITAIISILHRISGIIIFFSIGFIIWILKLSLSSNEEFNKVVNIIHNRFVKFFILIVIINMLYHICSGIRHLLMDFGFLEETLIVGKKTASLVVMVTFILSILIGVVIC